MQKKNITNYECQILNEDSEKDIDGGSFLVPYEDIYPLNTDLFHPEANLHEQNSPSLPEDLLELIDLHETGIVVASTVVPMPFVDIDSLDETRSCFLH